MLLTSLTHPGAPREPRGPCWGVTPAAGTRLHPAPRPRPATITTTTTTAALRASLRGAPRSPLLPLVLTLTTAAGVGIGLPSTPVPRPSVVMPRP
ncbi:hypothetical protein E2C01_088530 [Portunus trituberculatus]|uniref:Uncharacterized protein n=1 Tax=Portunus trituberculatus TaxID=210409 RepID=A0A5B7JM50_PORTR|nr:hypothetical protein [Portunus trituberculatus]